MRFKDRSWLSDQGEIELGGLIEGEFQGCKVDIEARALESVDGILWVHNFRVGVAQNMRVITVLYTSALGSSQIEITTIGIKFLAQKCQQEIKDLWHI